MRLLPNNPVVQLLKSKMESGEIQKNTKPSVVHKSDPRFHQYELTRFRTCYNNLKLEVYANGILYSILYNTLFQFISASKIYMAFTNH